MLIFVIITKLEEKCTIQLQKTDNNFYSLKMFQSNTYIYYYNWAYVFNFASSISIKK